MHPRLMRRYLAFSLTLLLAACATVPQAPTTQPAVQAQPQASDLLGLTPQQLVGRFGIPALQVHEGTSLKLQFRGSSCVLDAYFYPSGGTLKVTHVDTRLPSGTDTDQAACVSTLRRSS